MKDGYPTYTDEVMKNPDGLSITQAMSKYNLASYSTFRPGSPIHRAVFRAASAESGY